MMNSDRKDDNTIVVIPVVRCALDIISDLYELVPQIKSYVRHMVLGESLLFLTSYLSSSDPKTVVSASTFISCIIQDLMLRDTPNGEFTADSEGERELPVGDLKGIYYCAMGMLDSYCKMRDSVTATTVHPVTEFRVSSKFQGKQYSHSEGRKVLSDCTNIITDRDKAKDLNIHTKAERKSMVSISLKINNSLHLRMK